MSRAIRVVKIGGSLLDLPDLPERVLTWLSKQTAAYHVLVVGGGAWVDLVRQANATRPMDDVAAHWLCIELMNFTARLFHSWCPEIPLVENCDLSVLRSADCDATIFAPAAWLRQNEPALPGTRLTPDWETTSDAIAGRLAVALDAEEFVLMKSTHPEQHTLHDLKALAAGGYADPMLARLSSELPPTRWTNLRSSPAGEFTIR